MTLLREVRLFVASPSDVHDERDAVESLAEEMNGTLGSHLRLHLKVLRAEKHVAPDLGPVQDIVTEQIGPYDIFVGIMWRRFGTPTQKAGSGTQEEFMLAFEKWKQDCSPRVMFYFCERPCSLSLEDLEQVRRVLEFRKALETQGFFHTYAETHEFKDRLRKDLTQVLLKHFRSPNDAPAREINEAPAPRVAEPKVTELENPGSHVSSAGVVAEPIPHVTTAAPGRTPQQEIKRLIGTARKLIAGGHSANIGLNEEQVEYLSSTLASGRFRNIPATEKARAALRDNLRKSYPRETKKYIPTFHVLDQPVTVEMFGWFADATGYKTRAERDQEKRSWRSVDRESRKDHPITFVCREDVDAFCTWIKEVCGTREARTPNSMEFEYMVRGGADSDNLFAWGREFELNQCNDVYWSGHKFTAPYDAFEKSRELKLWDLCGNVTEWLSDPAPGKAGFFLVAGASFRRVALFWGHASARGVAPAYAAADDIGFRLVLVD